MTYKLGSLFDGSGGFPLAGVLCGVEPVWAAEVEPYPIAVTRSRFPRMRHLGDISKVNGAEIEPVDIITFGSPCQDLSVAGKRAGLKHEANGDEETTRSGLFMEAVRIIKEMRTATNGQYPRFALWENVPGAFSSNSGEDFRVVCEEFIKIIEPAAFMPPVPKGGWNYADSYSGDGWSLAYRVLDAQYWGVPQRRRRIYLVADFAGGCAREVLFEREGLRGYFAEGRTPWQTTPADAQGCTLADDREGEGHNGTDGDGGRRLDAVSTVPYTLRIRSGCEGGGKGALVQTDKAGTLATNNDQYLFAPITDTHILDDQGGSVINVRDDGKAPTLRAETHGHLPKVMVTEAVGADLYNGTVTGDVTATVDTHARLVNGPTNVIYAVENHPADSRVGIDENGTVQTLPSRMGTGGGNVPMVMQPKPEERPMAAFSFDSLASNSMRSKNPHSGCREVDIAKTLDTTDPNPCKNQGGLAIVEEHPVICLQGNGIDRADTAGCNGAGWREDQAPTLCTTHGGEPAVVYAMDRAAYNQGWAEERVGALNCMHDQQAVTYPTQTRYIVRRLTPTECARLQGFADRWGDIDPKDSLTEDEYRFWLDVRNTHARINGKKEQDYTAKQMLTWYNKLQTDAAEYKMWGNGIALPTALYCLQGIADALAKAEEDDTWML